MDGIERLVFNDATADAFALAKAYRLTGDVKRSLGDGAGASTAWALALSALPANSSDRPGEMAEHAVIMQRAGRQGEADSLNAKLRVMGYQRLS